jgi:hypothetical protein
MSANGKSGMLYLVLCSVTLAVINVSYLVRKHRMLDVEVRKGVEQKLSASEPMVELAQLREERIVMRNLLRDILENEALIRHAAAMPDDERVTLIQYRKDRRFELFGETLAVLGEMKPAAVKWRKDARVG